MKAKTSYALVGLFVLLLSTAFIAALLWLTTGGPPKDYDFYVVYMTESVSGLSVDAPVKYKGVNVGRVRDIRLDPEEDFELGKAAQRVIENDADQRAHGGDGEQARDARHRIIDPRGNAGVMV